MSEDFKVIQALKLHWYFAQHINTLILTFPNKPTSKLAIKQTKQKHPKKTKQKPNNSNNNKNNCISPSQEGKEAFQ